MVDSLRTPISCFVTKCNVHDSLTIDGLMKKKFIDDDIFVDKCDTFLADTAYSSILNISKISDKNINVLMGANKAHINKNRNVKSAPNNMIVNYKKRGISENFFCNIQKYPCVINNYQKTIKSYEGLSIFSMCIYLSKKNKWNHKKKNNGELKKQRE